MMVSTCANETMFHGSGAVSGVPYFCVTAVYAGMPGSVASPNNELAIANVQIGKSPRPAITWPLRHSGAETIFLESVIAELLQALGEVHTARRAAVRDHHVRRLRARAGERPDQVGLALSCTRPA